jgi:hypothetical protein
MQRIPIFRVQSCQATFDQMPLPTRKRNISAPCNGELMRKVLLWIVFSLMTAAQAASFDSEKSIPPELKPSQQQAKAAHLTA